MIHFDLPKEQSSIIKVIGIGGGGSNAVNFMYDEGIEGVDFIVCNTDAQALADSPIPNKIHLGPRLTQGLGAGADPDVGRQATEESIDEIKKILEVNTKMAFVTAGMGGGTGTGGAPIVAKVCKDLGILTVGIVTSPFSYEGKRRMNQAKDGIENLKEHVDTLLVISNDKLRVQFGNLPFKAAFAKADNVLTTATKCITGIINTHGVVNVDFADVSTAMKNGGVAILGSATAEGEDRAQVAIDNALSSPLLNDSEIKGAQWILLNITSSEEHEHTIDEMDIIQAHVQQMAGEDCDVILGMGHDNSLGDKLGVTIIATGFQQRDIENDLYLRRNFAPKKEEKKISVVLGKEGEEKKIYGQDKLPLAFEGEEMKAENTEGQEESLQKDEVEDKIEPVPSEPEGPVFSFKPEEESPANVEKETPWIEKPKPVDNEGPKIFSKGIYTEIPSKKEESKPTPVKPEIEEHHHWNEEGKQEKKLKNNGLKLIYKDRKSDREDFPKTYKKPEENPNIARTVYPYPEYKKEHEADKSSTENHPRQEDRSDQEQKDYADERAQMEQRFAERSSRIRRINMDATSLENSNDLENVPAYLRRRVNLKDDDDISSTVDYSGYHVRKSEDGKHSEISTINTFLDGKKPD